jgi:outer membrane protein OmpA-like peptidoglycan-associated protein
MMIRSFAVLGSISVALAQPAAVQAYDQPDTFAATASFPIIFFDRGSSDIGSDKRAVLGPIVASYRGSRFTLTGHADRTGPSDLNMRLSLARVEGVRRYLVSQGIPDRCIQTHAMGESRPTVDTGDGVEEPQNRRVEITVEPGCTN